MAKRDSSIVRMLVLLAVACLLSPSVIADHPWDIDNNGGVDNNNFTWVSSYEVGGLGIGIFFAPSSGDVPPTNNKTVVADFDDQNDQQRSIGWNLSLWFSILKAGNGFYIP